MTHAFRIVLLAVLLTKGIVGFGSEQYFQEDSLKYSSQSNRSLLSQARKAADNDAYEEAKTIYMLLVSRDSTNALYNYECGLNFFLNLFEQPQSLPYFQKALKYSGKDTIEKVFYYLGQAYQLNNRYDEAITAYTNFMRFVKNNKKEIADINKKIQQCYQGKGFLATFNNVINIDNVGSNINSSEAEYVPVVKADESLMYFTARRKTNVGGEKETESNRYFEDMFISKGDSGIYHVGERFTLGDTLIKKLRNTGGHESVVSLSYDEKFLVTYRNNSLWYSEWINNGWSKPVRFPKTINFGEYQNHGSFSTSNDTLYFSSNGKGGYGGLDIYMSIKQKDGKWGKAINLGPQINTPEDEDSPSISADNTSLYFSSKGHNSMGGYDVYKSEFNYDQWLAPMNLGMPINSSGDDIYFKYDRNKKQAYFSSSRQRGFGDYDIYRLIDYGTPRFDDCQSMMNSLSTFPITFDAKKALDVKGPTKEYHWEFSDGEHAVGEVVTHEFKEPGKQSYKLYVLDPIVHTLLEEKDSSFTILNLDKVHFTSADTVLIDSLMNFTGVPTKIDNATILKYHWSFGDSTQGSDSSVTSHQFKGPGSYEVKLSMVARDDSTERVFQKCITKTINVLNKEEYMGYYLKTVARENKKKGFNTEMLGLTHLDFLAPDTTSILIDNLFDAAPVFIPKAKVLSYQWDFGDTLKKIATKKINHSYDSIGVYDVKMNVVFQMDSTKGIYERDVSKKVVVVSPAEFEKIALARGSKLFATTEVEKPKLNFLAPDTTTLNLENIFDSQPVFIANSKILKYNWSFGDSSAISHDSLTRHSYDSLGTYPVTLNVIYQDKKTKGIYEASVSKNVTVINEKEFAEFNALRNEKIAKNFTVTTLDPNKLDFIGPDTTGISIKNTFDSKQLRIANAEILKYEWNYGDLSAPKRGISSTHIYDSIGVFPVKLGLVYQDKKSKGIYETSLTKNIAVVDTQTFNAVSSSRKKNEKVAIEKIAETSKINPQFDTTGIPNIQLENIYFDFDKYNIRPDAKEALLRNIDLLGTDTLLTVKINANTDSRGSKSYNFKLSAKRAISAINFMAEHQISRNRIIAVVSLGETNLVNHCKDNIKCNERQHQLNRRDEFKVVGKLAK